MQNFSTTDVLSRNFSYHKLAVYWKGLHSTWTFCILLFLSYKLRQTDKPFTSFNWVSFLYWAQYVYCDWTISPVMAHVMIKLRQVSRPLTFWLQNATTNWALIGKLCGKFRLSIFSLSYKSRSIAPCVVDLWHFNSTNSRNVTLHGSNVTTKL